MHSFSTRGLPRGWETTWPLCVSAQQDPHWVCEVQQSRLSLAVVSVGHFGEWDDRKLDLQVVVDCQRLKSMVLDDSVELKIVSHNRVTRLSCICILSYCSTQSSTLGSAADSGVAAPANCNKFVVDMEYTAAESLSRGKRSSPISSTSSNSVHACSISFRRPRVCLGVVNVYVCRSQACGRSRSSRRSSLPGPQVVNSGSLRRAPTTACHSAQLLLPQKS